MTAGGGDAGDGEGAGTRSDAAEGETVVVLNPASGGTNEDRVRDLAAARGYRVVETEGPGDGERLAREAAGSASTVVAAGGDGTVHEVVNGLAAGGALDAVTVGVVPTGTGNNFAGNVGVTGVEHAFEVLETGDVREIDLGTFEGEPADGPAAGVFVNSCIGGLTAEASRETTADMKRRLGVVAYVVETLRRMAEFDPLPLTVETRRDDGTADEAGGVAADGDARDGPTAWSGEAAFVLVGNGRRFPVRGRTQGHVEDGLLEVTIIGEMPAREVVEEAALQRLFGRDTEHVTRLRSPVVDVSVRGGESASFSLDGEMGDYADVSLGVRERSLRLRVGEGYRPDPDEGDRE